MFDTEQVVQTTAPVSNNQPAQESVAGSQNETTRMDAYYRKNGIDPATVAGSTSSEDPEKGDADQGVKPEQSDSAPPTERSDDVKQGQGKQGRSGYQRTIDKQTAQLARSRSKIENLTRELEELKGRKPDTTKVTEDHFATRQEYDDYMLERKLDNRDAVKRTSEIERQLQEEETVAFKSTWAPLVDQFYRTPEEKRAFSELLRTPNEITKPMQDFVDTSTVGPLMLEYLLRNADIASRLARMPAHVQGPRLAQLEIAIHQHVSGQYGTTRNPAPGPSSQRQVSNAPAPVGQVTTRGGSGHGDVADGSRDAVKRYLRQHYGS